VKFADGDTLLARITPCLENGKTAFIDFLGEGEVGWGSTEFIVLRPKAGIPPYFAYLLCREQAFRSFAIQSMTGTAGRQRVQMGLLGNYRISVPPVHSGIGASFARIIDPLIRKTSSNSRENATLRAIRDTLLPRLISGKLRIRAAEQNVGRVL
jgi:type I restriction enzyme S subunit